MRGNRISILSGDDTSVFADELNGILQAFGMAFVQVCHMKCFLFDNHPVF
jgi:hypothetical protein